MSERIQAGGPAVWTMIREARWRGGQAVLAAIAMASGAGCERAEHSPSGPAIVQIGDSAITVLRYRVMLQRVESSYAVARGFSGRKYYRPPGFQRCVTNRRIGIEPRAAVLEECRGNYARMQHNVLESMVEAEWLEQEAKRVGVEVRGGSASDRIVQLRATLARRVVESTRHRPSPAAISRYYDDHRRYFVQPERRAARALLIRTKRAATDAKRALLEGRSWPAVATRSGGTPPSRMAGTREEFEPSLGRAVFRARASVIVGPVNAEAGWYVLQVTAVIPRLQLSLGRSQVAIEDYLEQRERSRATVAYWRRLYAGSRALTTCLTGLKIPACRNGPRSELGEGIPSGLPATRPTLPPVWPDP